MSLVPKDVVLLPESTALHPDRWVAMNVFSRTCLGVSGDVVRFLGGLTTEKDDAPGPFRCWDIERFSNEDGLLADPSRYQRDMALWKECVLGRDALMAKLQAHFIIVDDEAAYRERFRPKRHLLDRKNFGNFHQQHGQHMLLSRRTDPAKWWMQQKFTPDCTQVRSDTLYGAVQWRFLDGYFARKITPGMEVVDLGCGPGIYANEMARHGATVLGVDPSEEYLATARANAVPGTSFARMAIGEAGGLDAIASGSVDLVFMSDALLFYFVPLYPGQNADIRVLLTDIRRILKPGGIFVSVEPQGTFFLAPWLGSPDRPFTIVSEYLRRSYGIVPSLPQMFEAVADAGFALTALLEIGPDDYFVEVDRRGYHFAREFPLWQLLEFSLR
jgi:SAM-dependent methyltransferase